MAGRLHRQQNRSQISGTRTRCNTPDRLGQFMCCMVCMVWCLQRTKQFVLKRIWKGAISTAGPPLGPSGDLVELGQLSKPRRNHDQGCAADARRYSAWTHPHTSPSPARTWLGLALPLPSHASPQVTIRPKRPTGPRKQCTRSGGTAAKYPKLALCQVGGNRLFPSLSACERASEWSTAFATLRA